MTGEIGRRWVGGAARALLGLALLVPLGPASATGAGTILPGFDSRAAASIIGRPAEPFECAPVPPPLVDMSHYLSRYDPKDPTQSKVDPARVAAVADREKRLQGFARQLARMADRQIASVPPNPAITRCVWTHLATWARADALFGNVDENDPTGRRLVLGLQAWQLTTYAAVALKVAGPQDAEIAASRAVALPWMRRLAESAMTQDQDPNPATRLRSNPLYWVGVAAAYSSALLQDAGLKGFAVKALRSGLDDVSDEGALTSEMRRGSRALMYQQFGTLPLALLAQYAAANAVELSRREQAALVRLVDFSARAVTDPTAIAALARVPQQASGDHSSLAWIDVIRPYVARLDPAVASRLDGVAEAAHLRPSWHIYAGGAVTAVYDPTRLAKQPSR